MPEVLFQLSGSIAAYKACHVVSRLVQAGCAVQTAATRAALEFVGPATLEGLTGRPVATETFAPGSLMNHIHLVRRADLVVLCPATANSINRLAAGIADDLIGTMFLAHDFRVPYVVVPAMNSAMYDHPATRLALDRLRSWGVQFIDPSAGSLACGEIGPGRLAEPDDIVADLLGRLHAAPAAPVDVASAVSSRPRILITAGGTKVPIDGVRSITNTSTGATGSALATHFAGAGYDVTLLHASDALLPGPTGGSVTLRSFTTFDELADALDDLLHGGSFDAVIHLAAVSDYDLDHLVVDGRTVTVDTSSKVDTGDVMEVHLKRNPKLLPHLKDLGGNEPVVVGFKLTHGASSEQRADAVRSITTGTDLVVHNDVTELGGGDRRATVYRSDEALDVLGTATDNAELAVLLERQIATLLASRHATSPTENGEA
jgi:phosphopantothenoylcysteine decarboxylase / phosphopantothenate---cysteine ligase